MRRNDCGRRHAWTDKTPDSWIVRDCPLPMEKKTINFFVGPKRGVPQLRIPQLSSPLSSPPAHPSVQLLLSLPIGDDGIPQYGSKFLSSAHLSAQLQLTHQLSSSFHFLLATTNLPVCLRIPQLSSPLSSAPAHPSAQLQLPLPIGDDGISQFASGSLKGSRMHNYVGDPRMHNYVRNFSFLCT